MYIAPKLKYSSEKCWEVFTYLLPSFRLESDSIHRLCYVQNRGKASAINVQGVLCRGELEGKKQSALKVDSLRLV